MKKTYDCGIDLGTTNSCIAISEDGLTSAVIESTTDNQSTTPSAVYITKNGKIVVGQAAYQRSDRSDVAVQFKRLMGTDTLIKFAKSGLEKKPEELSAEVLKKLAQDMKVRTGKDPLDVVITIPAAFSTMQSEATIAAGKLAGFRNVTLLQEPIAASIAYGVRPDVQDKYWMVFDYGGGTLDVAIVSTYNGRLKVINSDGNNLFGGCDVDRSVLDKVILPKMSGLSMPISSSLRNSLLKEVENAKKNLGDNDSVNISIMGLEDDDEEEIEFEYEMQRGEFEAAIDDIINGCIEIAQKTLDGSGITSDKLEKILLVGGSTYLQYLRNRLAEVFNTPVDTSVNPMHAVAIGASYFAAEQMVEIEEETAETTSANEEEVVSIPSLELRYEMKSAKDRERIGGQVTGADILPVKAVFTEAEREVGTFPINDKGVFMGILPLSTEGKHEFNIKLYDASGSEMLFKGEKTIAILRKEHMLKLSNAPMTHSVCVSIMEDGIETLDVVLKKNTTLPATQKVAYKINRTLTKGSMDSISFKVYEGEIYDNPMANICAGKIEIKGSDLEADIKKDETVELEISVDENRNIHVSGFLPATGYTIPETTLLEKNMMSLESRLDALEGLFRGMELSLQKLEGSQVANTRADIEEFKALKESYEEQFDLLDTDPGAVYKYIERFYLVQTRLIRLEREMSSSNRLQWADNLCEEQMERIERFGSFEQVQEAKERSEQVRQAKTADEMNFYAGKLQNYVQECLNGSIDYWKMVYGNMTNAAVRFGITDNPEYIQLCARASEAIEKNDAPGLRAVVNSLGNMLDNAEKENEKAAAAQAGTATKEDKELADLKRSFEALQASGRLDMANAKVARLCQEGLQAIMAQNNSALREVNRHLQKYMGESAEEAARKNSSDLRK